MHLNGYAMFLFATLALTLTFFAVIGSVVLTSIDRAASLVDNPAMDLLLPRK